MAWAVAQSQQQTVSRTCPAFHSPDHIIGFNRRLQHRLWQASRLLQGKVTQRSSVQSRALSRPLDSCQQHDVVAVQTSDGSTEYVEAVQGWNAAEKTCRLVWKGKLVQLGLLPDGSMQLESLGVWAGQTLGLKPLGLIQCRDERLAPLNRLECSGKDLLLVCVLQLSFD